MEVFIADNFFVYLMSVHPNFFSHLALSSTHSESFGLWIVFIDVIEYNQTPNKPLIYSLKYIFLNVHEYRIFMHVFRSPAKQFHLWWFHH